MGPKPWISIRYGRRHCCVYRCGSQSNVSATSSCFSSHAHTHTHTHTHSQTHTHTNTLLTELIACRLSCWGRDERDVLEVRSNMAGWNLLEIDSLEKHCKE